jgi:hypothetical protein
MKAAQHGRYGHRDALVQFRPAKSVCGAMARLWRDHGKVQQARELLAPVYGWFT